MARMTWNGRPIDVVWKQNDGRCWYSNLLFFCPHSGDIVGRIKVEGAKGWESRKVSEARGSSMFDSTSKNVCFLVEHYYNVEVRDVMLWEEDFLRLWDIVVDEVEKEGKKEYRVRKCLV